MPSIEVFQFLFLEISKTNPLNSNGSLVFALVPSDTTDAVVRILELSGRGIEPEISSGDILLREPSGN